MAFDWTKVEGYREDMTADEKLELLNNLPDPEPAQEVVPTVVEEQPIKPVPTPKPTANQGGSVSKAQFDKVSSELAAVKKQLRSRMTDEEQKEAERQASEDAMRIELETLRKERTLSAYKAQYLSQGYDEALADEAAIAMADGDMDSVFSIMKRQSALHEKALRAKILKETPVPPAGDTVTIETEKQKKLAEMRRSLGLPV